MIIGVSDQFAGHGPGFSAHSKAQTSPSEPRSAKERVDMLLKDRHFYDRGRPCVAPTEDGRVTLFAFNSEGQPCNHTSLG